MPTVKKGEKQKEFVSRCIPIVMKEGKTLVQAQGKCFGMWKQRKIK